MNFYGKGCRRVEECYSFLFKRRFYKKEAYFSWTPVLGNLITRIYRLFELVIFSLGFFVRKSYKWSQIFWILISYILFLVPCRLELLLFFELPILFVPKVRMCVGEGVVVKNRRFMPEKNKIKVHCFQRSNAFKDT